MDVEGIITERDFIKSQFLHIKPNVTFTVLGLLICVLVLFVLIFISFSWLILAIVTYLLAYFFMYLPYRAKKIYRDYKVIQDKVHIIKREDGLLFRNSRGEGLLQWGDIKRIKTNSDLVLIYPTDVIYYIIPAHFFAEPSQFDDFSIELKQKLNNT